MAKERVQVQGLGGQVPGIQPTIQRAGQYSVAQVKAPRNKLMDLADALGQVNPALQAYGQIQEFQFKKGIEQGEIEGATADLESSITNLDVAGEKLVEQGLLPRSQLVGYQRAFRERIGQREAKSSYFKNLNDRVNEVTQNLEGDEDIIGSIIAEEREKSLQRLGTSPLALQGFAKYSDSIDNSFFANATKKRDRAVQDFNEGMVIEDLNQDFGEQLTKATDPESIAQLQLQLKSRLDEVSGLGQIPRSRVVELAWNGFVVPNVNNLLVGEDPQPDKAEQVLDSILDIDLTGKGGKLGNINREGAYIRSKAVELRRRIDSARDAIEQDEGSKAKDIMELYMPAASAVASGPTGDIELDALQNGAIIDYLIDAGYSNEEAQSEAYSLLKSQDLRRLQALGLNYRYDDSKRGAWNAATGSLNSFTINLVAKTDAVLSRREIENTLEDIDTQLAKDPKANVNTMLAAKGITDPRVKAQAIKKSQEAQENLWFEKTPSFRNFDNQFEDALDTVVDVAIFSEFETGERKGFKSEGRALFQEQYQNRLRDLQSSLKEDPDRDSKIINKIPEIQKDITKKWKEFKTLDKKFREGRFKQISEEQAAGELIDIPTIEALEEAGDNIDNVLNSWVESFITTYAPTLLFGQAGEVAEIASRREEIEDQILSADIPVNAKDRSKAFLKADYIETQLKTERYKDNEDLKSGVSLIRKVYGYRNPSEIEDAMVSELDFRITPMYESEDALLQEARQALKEIQTFQRAPQQVDVKDFPTYTKYNNKFGINSEQQLEAFVKIQREVLLKRNK